MSQLTQRLLLFFLGTPLLIVIIMFVPMYNHIVWNIVMILGSLAGTAEFYKILTRKFNIHLRKLPFVGAYLPIAAYLEMAGITFQGFTSLVLIILVSIFSGCSSIPTQNTGKQMENQVSRLLSLRDFSDKENPIVA